MRKNDGYVSSNKGDVERSTTLLDRACGLCARSHREHQRVHWDAAWHAGKYIQAQAPDVELDIQRHFQSGRIQW